VGATCSTGSACGRKGRVPGGIAVHVRPASTGSTRWATSRCLASPMIGSSRKRHHAASGGLRRHPAAKSRSTRSTSGCPARTSPRRQQSHAPA
jgi:hypothetical protein